MHSAGPTGRSMIVTSSSESEPTPWVRVIIVNYNAGLLLQECIDALSIQTMASFEAVIVDNGSTTPPIDHLQLPDDRFSIERVGRNIGFAAGCNLGAQGTKSPWVAMLNPDARPAAHWLAELRAATVRHRHAIMFGSTQLDGHDPEIVDGFGDTLSAYGMAWRNLGGHAASDLPNEDREVFSPCAAASLYATPSFEVVGGFDEIFFCYLEDVDLGFRLRLRGERCMQIRRAEVLHQASSISGRMSPFSIFHSYRNRIWMLAKDMPPLLLAPAFVGWLAATILSLARPRAKSYRWDAVRGSWCGIKGLSRALRARGKVQRERKIGTVETAQMLLWNPLGRTWIKR